MNPKKQKKCTQSDKDKKMNPKKQRKYTQNDKQKENKLFENNQDSTLERNKVQAFNGTKTQTLHCNMKERKDKEH